MWRCWYLYQISRKTRLQLFSLCTRRWRRYRPCSVSEEMKSTTIEKKTEIDIQESFSFIHNNLFFKNLKWIHQLLRPHFLKKMIYVADHRPEKNSDEYTESILRLYLFGDRMISSAKRVQICWITHLFVVTRDLPYSSVCFRSKQAKLVKEGCPSMSVFKLQLGTFRVVHRASCILSWSIFPLSIYLSGGSYLVLLIGQLTSIRISS